MASIVPLQATPSQNVSVGLGGQSCLLKVYQKFFGLYMDVYVDDTLIVGGVLCENLNRIVRSAYLGFVGDFAFIDTQGTSDPEYAGLGARYKLAYIEESELPTGGG